MEKEDMARKTHVLVIPFPVSGHMNPMVQFSKRLASKGLDVTVIAATTAISKSMQNECSSIKIECIYDGWNEAEQPESIEASVARFKIAVSQSLSEYIEKQKNSSNPAKVLVYDSVMIWALEIAHRHGLLGASFFTQNVSVCAIYYHLQQGTLKIPTEGSIASMPSMPVLEISDLPSFISDVDSYPIVRGFILGQFLSFQEADWLLFNTFDKLEEEVVNWMASQWPIKTIGPTIPSKYLDNRLEDDNDYGLSLFRLDSGACIEWLDSKESGSVVYVSFGSLANLGEQQMEELALGLLRSKTCFLWVVRASEESKLPSHFKDEASENGLVVNWCPQIEVLNHRAVGCFITHCGWNSTLEALSLGVPLVAMPQWTDQTTNAKFIEDVWHVGVRTKADEKGIVGREEIERCIKQVMEGELKNELNRNAARWKELAKEAVDEGGSSDNNIDEFISKLQCS